MVGSSAARDALAPWRACWSTFSDTRPFGCAIARRLHSTGSRVTRLAETRVRPADRRHTPEPDGAGPLREWAATDWLTAVTSDLVVWSCVKLLCYKSIIYIVY